MTMNRNLSHLDSEASWKTLWPILGMLGGLSLGGLLAWAGSSGELTTIALVIAGGITGSGLGMGAILAVSYRLQKGDLTSLKGLMTIVLVAAIVLWFILTFLSDMLAHGLR
jgi:hypothetical protein